MAIFSGQELRQKWVKKMTVEKLKSVGAWMLARLEEPSTWAGGSVLALAIHAAFPGTLGNAIIAVIASIGGLLAVVVPEKK